MADFSDLPASEPREGLSLSVLFLRVGAILLALVLTAVAVAPLTAGAPTLADVFGAIGLAVAGWAGGLLLWGVGDLLTRIDALREAVLRAPGGGGSVSGARAEVASIMAARSVNRSPVQQEQVDQLAALLREIRDISLLTDEQRSARMNVQAHALYDELSQHVPVLLREQNWVEARRRLREAQQRYPTFDGWQQWDGEIERVRRTVEERDVETAAQQINELAALGAWERAADVIRELMERHPESPRVAELDARVQRERKRHESEQRSRLMSQAQDAVNRRAWSAALSAANALIQRFPTSPEAYALRQQLPTLRENSEIVLRRKMESDFRELLNLHAYEEALHLAHELIERYPGSPQAAALRDRLPWLEEKAQQSTLTR